MGKKAKYKSVIDVESLFTEESEIKIAIDLVQRYLKDYTLETASDKNTLREIIYLEVVQRRLQEKLNEYYSKDSKAIPTQLIETVHKNSTVIINLKNTLGLTKSKDSRNAYDVLEHLKKRFKQWREENQGSRTMSCPHCGKMILMKIRTDIWESQKHPYFKDKFLYNKHLMSLLNNGVITKEDAAKVLGCSTDYLSWIATKLKTKITTERLEPERENEEKNNQDPISESGNTT